MTLTGIGIQIAQAKAKIMHLNKGVGPASRNFCNIFSLKCRDQVGCYSCFLITKPKLTHLNQSTISLHDFVQKNKQFHWTSTQYYGVPVPPHERCSFHSNWSNLSEPFCLWCHPALIVQTCVNSMIILHCSIQKKTIFLLKYR